MTSSSNVRFDERAIKIAKKIELKNFIFQPLGTPYFQDAWPCFYQVDASSARSKRAVDLSQNWIEVVAETVFSGHFCIWSNNKWFPSNTLRVAASTCFFLLLNLCFLSLISSTELQSRMGEHQKILEKPTKKNDLISHWTWTTTRSPLTPSSKLLNPSWNLSARLWVLRFPTSLTLLGLTTPFAIRFGMILGWMLFLLKSECQ